jgi:hypothetical protein
VTSPMPRGGGGASLLRASCSMGEWGQSTHAGGRASGSVRAWACSLEQYHKRHDRRSTCRRGETSRPPQPCSVDEFDTPGEQRSCIAPAPARPDGCLLTTCRFRIWRHSRRRARRRDVVYDRVRFSGNGTPAPCRRGGMPYASWREGASETWTTGGSATKSRLRCLDGAATIRPGFFCCCCTTDNPRAGPRGICRTAHTAGCEYM